jgi:hypothetical protein
MSKKIDRRNFSKLILSAAGGVLAGATIGCQSNGENGETEAGAPLPLHACKGLNECAGKGGCKTEASECRGLNECAGKGGCATVPHHSCAGKNSCEGLGGCTSGDKGCKAKNTCEGKGGCAVPIQH